MIVGQRAGYNLVMTEAEERLKAISHAILQQEAIQHVILHSLNWQPAQIEGFSPEEIFEARVSKLTDLVIAYYKRHAAANNLNPERVRQSEQTIRKLIASKLEREEEHR